MKKRIIIWKIFLVLVLPSCLAAKDTDLLPGVTASDVSAIQAQVNATYSANYRVLVVLNVDSSLGDGLGPRWP